MGKAEKSHMGTVKVNGKLTEVKMDKKSGTGLRGSPKKGGRGGKWTWSGDGYSKAEIGFAKEVVDVKDPNYEDPEPEETVAVAV
ncbi:hypothetical protein Pint_13295 [Pistacia integerrima]|uniref:Uncharacterized protein n=2 Tax=Pistacia TaxID=55512 RepID=A0ACC1AXI7_9ROSI|nr:hypothetical protein Pint_13295 [Pistacia integerrima]KAJ0091360.1 hypothetical protein Patl1_13371 [Pistacia atlantica]